MHVCRCLLVVLVLNIALAATTRRRGRVFKYRGARTSRRATTTRQIKLNIEMNETSDVMGYKVIIEKGLKGTVWLVSHGGVKSEWLYGRMGLPSKWHQVQPSKRPFRGVTAHYPRPIAGPKIALYVFGDVYNSVVSQLRRHPYNPAKLHNRRSFPYLKFDNFVEFGKLYSDVYGIEGQFMNWMTQKASYPIVFVRTDCISKDVFKVIGGIFKVQMKKFDLRERKSHWEEQPSAIKDMLIRQYWRLDALFNVMPPITMKLPSKMPVRSAQLVISTAEKPDFWYAANAAQGMIADLWKSPKAFDHAVAAHLSKTGFREKHYVSDNGIEVFNYRCMRGKAPQKYICPSGIITRCHMQVTSITQKSKGWGFEDLRTVQWRDSMWIVSRGNCPQSTRSWKCKHAQFLINPCSGAVVHLHSPNLHLQGKNWLPYNDRGRMRFIYSFKDATMVDSVLELVDVQTGLVKMVFSIGPKPSYNKKAGIYPSFIVPYQYPIYAGFAHTHETFRGMKQSIYRSVPILFNAQNFRLVSKGVVNFPNATQDYARKCTRQWRKYKKGITWTHAMQFRENAVLISNNIQDRCTMVHSLSVDDISEVLHLNEKQYEYLYQGTKTDFVQLEKRQTLNLTLH